MDSLHDLVTSDVTQLPAQRFCGRGKSKTTFMFEGRGEGRVVGDDGDGVFSFLPKVEARVLRYLKFLFVFC